MADNYETILTPSFRMSYANIVEPRAFMEKGKPKGDPFFSCQMIYDIDDLDNFEIRNENTDGPLLEFKSINNILRDLIMIEWPGIVIKEEFKTGVNWPIKSGDAIAKKLEKSEKGDPKVYQGKKVIGTKTRLDKAPKLQYMDDGVRKNILVGTVAGDRQASLFFKSGNYAFAEINLSPTKVSGVKYIAFYLQNIVFVKQGESLGQRQSLMDMKKDYSGVQGSETDHDPTEGLDDEIPF